MQSAWIGDPPSVDMSRRPTLVECMGQRESRMHNLSWKTWQHPHYLVALSFDAHVYVENGLPAACDASKFIGSVKFEVRRTVACVTFLFRMEQVGVPLRPYVALAREPIWMYPFSETGRPTLEPLCVGSESPLQECLLLLSEVEVRPLEIFALHFRCSSWRVWSMTSCGRSQNSTSFSGMSQ